MTKTTLVIADDHKLFRLGLRQLLERETSITVAGEAATGLEVIEVARNTKPDIILMDISMPEINGIEAARRIIDEQDKTKIIILSMHSDRRYILESLRIGARGYLLKDSAPEELVQAIRKVMSGQFYLSARINASVIADYLNLSSTENTSPFQALSGREREVLQLIAEGHSTKETADKLNLSAKTVETHKQHIMDKLNIHTVAELTRYAIKEGLSPLE
jgi:DNA-binding NarL/FixJ family response regulator